MTEPDPPVDHDIDELLLEATRLSDAGDDAAAFQMLIELEPAHPEHPTLLCMIGALAAHLGADGMAVDFFKRCLALGPSDPRLLVTAGAGLAAVGDPAAEPALRLAALSAPELVAARMHYGAYLVRAGLLDEGLAELVAARTLAPDDAEVAREIGIAHLAANRPDRAIEDLELAASADEGAADSRLLLGLALIHDGDIARAAEELYPIAETFQEDAETQVLFALTFALEGWENEAWLALSRAEAATVPIDQVVAREVEDALETGDDAVRSMLLDAVAPTALRSRISWG